ncbi:MAG: ribose 5-phosphate isomerase B [Candidatus Cyclobacteriaceae bacterium M2_1C_046]
MKISIGADHAGFEYKQQLINKLKEDGHNVTDHGTDSPESVDYPDFAHPVADDVSESKADLGILICGSANGVAMAANKHSKVRAAICWNKELAELARTHNNANVLCIPSRFVAYELAETITDAFLKSSFEGGRHERRVNKISC